MVAFWVATSAGAQATEQSTEQPAERDTGRMVMVLDSSGSMNQPASGGQTKIAAAKEALQKVIGSLPEDQAVGLRVYGAGGPGNDQ